MKIENGELIFEVVPCWYCGGTGQQKLYKAGGESYTTGCCICNGVGTRREDRVDNITQDVLDYIVDNANYIFKGNYKHEVNLAMKLIADYHSGTNCFAGAQDYKDHRTDSAEALLQIIKKSAREHCKQALNYIQTDSNKINLDIWYFGYQGGYEATWIKTKK